MNPHTPRDTGDISTSVQTEPEPRTPAEMYLDLMKRILTRTLTARLSERQTIQARVFPKRLLVALIQSLLTPFSLELVRLVQSTPEDYLESGDSARNRAEDAETMLGIRQLDNMQACICDVISKRIPGDLLEAGVWRGGMTIFMRAVLKAHGDNVRRVWVADSFAGLPTPHATHDFSWWRTGDMAVSLSEVRRNFARYGLLDDQVQFIEGYFRNSLPSVSVSQLAVLRVDADLYESTLDVLQYLYSRLAPGGYAIFDDYNNLPGCRRAIDEFRSTYGVSEPIQPIDSRAVFWQKRLQD